MMTPKRARRMKRASRSHASALPSRGIVRTTMATSSQCARSAARLRFATTRTATSSVTKIAQMIQFATVANVCQPSDFASASASRLVRWRHSCSFRARRAARRVRPASVDQSGDAARAAATASSRELTPSARKSRRTWFLTVSVLRWSSAAICFVERPCSSRRSTST